MKMRRSLPFSGIFMRSAVDGLCERVAEPDGEEAERHGTEDVQSSVQPFAVAREIERLQAEGGKRRVTAAEAGHQEIPRRRAEQHPSLGAAESEDETDDERAGDEIGRG